MLPRENASSGKSGTGTVVMSDKFKVGTGNFNGFGVDGMGFDWFSF